MKNIPNLFTLLNLLFGCIAVILILQNGIAIMYNPDGQQYISMPERIWAASFFIGLAALVDFLDGLVARLFKAVSPIGKQLDSLADVVSFGVAPGMILYQFLRMSFMRPGGWPGCLGSYGSCLRSSFPVRRLTGWPGSISTIPSNTDLKACRRRRRVC